MKAFTNNIKTAFMTRSLLVCLTVFAFVVFAHPSFAEAAINLSGTLYSDIGATPITTAKTIKMVVGTSTNSIHSTTTNASGNFSFSFATSSLGNWSTSSAPGTLAPTAVAYGKGRFVAVGGGGAGVADVMTSEDGVTWVERNASVDLDWKWISYGEGTFVAVAYDGGVMYSRDGITWTTALTDSDPKLDTSLGITYGNGTFVAVPGGGSGSFVAYSHDGVNWATSSIGFTTGWHAIAFGNGKFIMSNWDWGAPLYYSTDGITWSNSGVTFPGGPSGCLSVYGITYGNGRFVGMCYDNTNSTYTSVTSSDGLTWVGHNTAPEDNAWGVVHYANGYFIARSDGGTSRLMYGTDGINWTAVNIGAFDDIWNTGITYGEGKFVSVNAAGTSKIFYANAGLGPDTPITFYVDGDAVDATTYLMGASSTDIANIPLYQSNVVVMNANGTAASSTTKLSDMHRYSSADDVDVLFTATTTGTTTMQAPMYISRGTVEAPTYLELKGNFTNLGTFDHSYGTTTLIGTNQTLRTTATTTFYDLYQVATTTATTTFATTSVIATAGKLTLQGTTTSPLKLRSTNDGTQWTIYPTGTSSVSYLDVKDSKNSSTTGISCETGCVDGGNNTNWIFAIAGLNLSGILFDTVGSPITTGKTIKMVVGTSTQSIHTTTSDGSGAFSFSVSTSTISSFSGVSAAGNNDQWKSVTYGRGLFVAVGYSGDRVMTSPDGITWTTRSAAGNDDNWSDVVYAKGLFVAVGDSGDRVMTSPDGFSWTARSVAGDNDSWQGLTFGNGRFVAVGDSGDRVMYSDDGITWATTTAAGDNDEWNGVTFGNGRFVAVGDSGDRVMYSDDGITWVTASAAGDNDSWSDVTFGNGKFVAVSNSGDRVMTSPDGITWTAQSALGNNDFWVDVTYANGLYVAVSCGFSCPGEDVAMISSDGITWTSHTIAENDDDWYSITYGAGKFVAVGDVGDDLVAAANAGLGPDTPITLFVDGDSVDATTYLMGASSTDIANIPLYQSTVVAMNVNGTAASSTTKLSDMSRYSSTDDADILFTATTTGTTTMQAPLYIARGTVEAPTYLELKGDFTNLGTFDHRYGTTTLIGTNQTLRTAATTTFYDLTQIATTTATTTFATTSVIATAGKLTLQGASSTVQLKLRSTNSGTQWTIYPTGPISVSYLDVKDSKNSSSTAISCLTGCTNNGNNTNWTLPAMIISFTGTLYSDTGATPITTGKTIKLVVGTSTPSIHTDTSDGSGVFSIDFATSTMPGTSWSSAAGVADDWRSVAYGNGRFVAVAENGSNGQVMYSDNGTAWTSSTAAETTANSWKDITYGKGLFVAVGNGQSSLTDPIMTSPDGITWTARTADPPGNYWTGVTYGNGRFVAVARNGTWRVMTSDDGITWTSQADDGTDKYWQQVTYGNGLFVAIACGNTGCASGGTNLVMTSPDGTSWTSRTSPEGNTWKGIAYGNGRFVAVAGNSSATNNRVMYSLDGITWATSTPAAVHDWQRITYVNGFFVAVAAGAATSTSVMTSPDGITWTSQAAIGTQDWLHITQGDGKLVAVAASGANRVMTADAGFGPNTPITLYVDGDAVDATTLTTGTNSTSTVTGVDLYQGYVLLKQATSSQSIDLPRLTFTYDSTDDADILFTATTSTTTVSAGLVVATSSQAVAPFTLAVAGNLENRGTFESEEGATLLLTGSSKTLSGTLIATSALETVVISGSYTANSNASTSELTIQNGASFTAPTAFTVVGDYRNDGTFTAGSGTAYLTGVGNYDAFSLTYTPSIATGNMTGSSAFNHVVVSDGVGYGYGLAFAGSASTSNLHIRTGSILSPALTVRGPLTVAGDLTLDGDALLYAPTSTLYLAGDVTLCTGCAAGFYNRGGTVRLTGTGKTLRGPMTGLQTFNDLVVAGSYIMASSASTTNLTIASGGSLTAPSVLTVAGDFSNAGTFNANSGTLVVGPSRLWSLATPSYVGATSTQAQDSGATGLAFKPDGTRLYIVGIENNKVYAYDLTTPWDITTASYGNASSSVASQTASPYDLAFSSDGTKMYVVHQGGDKVFQYALSTPWDITTASYGNASTSVSQQDNPEAIAFSSDGTKMYVSGASAAISQYNLSAAWDVTSASFSTTSDILPSFNTVTGLAFKPDGTKVLVAPPSIVLGTPQFEMYTLLTPWDISTLDTSTLETGFSELYSASLGFNNVALKPDGTALYTNHTGGDGVSSYLLADDPQQTLSGTLTATSSLNHVSFTDATTTVLAANASTSNFTIASGTTLIAPSALTITGNYTNSGTLTATTGTVYFGGSAAQTATGTLSGSSDFNNLTVTNTSGNGTTTPSVAFGAPLETAGTFTMRASTSASFVANATSSFAAVDWNGSAASPIYLRSSTPGTAWGLDTDGAVTATYVNVRDSYYASTTVDVTCTNGCVDNGNNTNWNFNAATFMGSAADQSLYVGQATTTLEDITIIEPLGGANVTAASDIRISIPTSTVNFRFDTTNTSLSFSGTASSKVGNPVTYENGGATVVIPVSSNFSAEDTLVISGLEVGSFAAVSTTTDNLELHLGGSVDGTPDATDTEVVGITGSLTLSDHSNTQPASQFSSSDENDATLFAFTLTPATENATVTALTIDLSQMNAVNSSRLTDLKLYRDTDSDRVVDAGDVQVGGTGVLVNNGQTGSITFSTPFLASTSEEYIISGDTTNIPAGARVTMNLNTDGLTTTGTSSGRAVAVLGSIESATHSRLTPGGGGHGGAGNAIGGDAPASGGNQSGGGGGSGIGIGEGGDTLTLDPGFHAPSSTGDPQNEWTNGNNAYLSNNAYATAASGGLRQGYGTFAFSIPGDNTIQGIVVKLEASGSTAAGDIAVALSWDGGSTFTSTKTTATLSGTDTIYTLGSPSDTWGRSWGVSEFSNGNFRLRVIANPSSNTVRIDAITVRPYHQIGGGGGGAGDAL